MYEEVGKELEEKFVVSDFPLNIAVEVTNQCNLNCIMCGRDTMTRKHGSIKMSLYKKIVDEIANENPNTRIWLDFYGEPLIAGFKLYYMVDYAKKKGCTNVFTNSNGQLLTNEYADMLLDSGIDYISLDCDGYSKKVYESIRVGGNRDLFYSNVEYLLAERDRRHSDTKIDIKIIEMDENKNEIDKITEYWKNRGAWTAVRRKSDWARFRLNPESQNDDRIACGHAIGTCAITWDGNMAGCPWDGNCDMNCGSVVENSVKELWMERNDTIVKLHVEHRWNELPQFCQDCNTWKNIGEMRIDEEGNQINRNYGFEDKLFARAAQSGNT